MSRRIAIEAMAAASSGQSLSARHSAESRSATFVSDIDRDAQLEEAIISMMKFDPSCSFHGSLPEFPPTEVLRPMLIECVEYQLRQP
jgi:hypothetical protein